MTRNDHDTPVAYVTPTIETLSDREILEEIGPAHAYTGAFPFSF